MKAQDNIRNTQSRWPGPIPVCVDSLNHKGAWRWEMDENLKNQQRRFRLRGGGGRGQTCLLMALTGEFRPFCWWNLPHGILTGIHFPCSTRLCQMWHFQRHETEVNHLTDMSLDGLRKRPLHRHIALNTLRNCSADGNQLLTVFLLLFYLISCLSTFCVLTF